jgi:hypothetical protein
MDVLGCSVLHSDTVTARGNTTTVTIARAEASRRTDSSIKIAAPSLGSLPSVMAQVGVVAEDEAAAPTGRQATRNGDGFC